MWDVILSYCFGFVYFDGELFWWEFDGDVDFFNGGVGKRRWGEKGSDGEVDFGVVWDDWVIIDVEIVKEFLIRDKEC